MGCALAWQRRISDAKVEAEPPGSVRIVVEATHIHRSEESPELQLVLQQLVLKLPQKGTACQ